VERRPKEAAAQAKPRADKGSAVNDFDIERLAKLFFLLAGLLATVTLAAYTVTAVRRKINAKGGSASGMLDNFREMHERGQLSDNEFRTIKTRMASRLRAELSDADEKG
jgi:hypothetical protein